MAKDKTLPDCRMKHTALRKLDSLLEEGYRINGVAIRRERSGLIPQQGFVTNHGMVGWWPGSNAAVDLEIEQLLARWKAGRADIPAHYNPDPRTPPSD